MDRPGVDVIKLYCFGWKKDYLSISNQGHYWQLFSDVQNIKTTYKHI